MSTTRVYVRDGARYLQVDDPAGQFLIPLADNEPERNTYRAFMFALAPSGVVQDVLQLAGVAGKVIRLKSLIVSGAATAATNMGVYLFKRTALSTGGTPTAVTKVASDTADAAASAVLNHYAAGTATTPGAGGQIDGCRLNLAPAANGGIDRFQFQYSWLNDKAPLVRSATESLCLSLFGQTMPAGGALDVALSWSEE
jgi:hypothetical protein